MDISTAQSDLRKSFVNGGPGALVSGLVWLVAAVVASRSGITIGFVVLFFGGMLIFPISNAIVRVVFHRPAPSKGNPGGVTVIETVFPMLAGFLAAWLILPYHPEYVFPLCAIAVGAHYFGFRTAYGDWTYWVFAAVLCLLGLASIFLKTPSAATVPFLVAVTEFIFGIYLTWAGMKKPPVSA